MTPEEKRDEYLTNIQPALKMDDAEFQEFKRTVVTPMMRRHQEMFLLCSTQGIRLPPA